MEANVDLLLLLGRLEGKMDTVLSQQSRVEGTVGDIERRVRVLETGWAKLLGASTAAAILASYLFQLFTASPTA